MDTVSVEAAAPADILSSDTSDCTAAADGSDWKPCRWKWLVSVWVTKLFQFVAQAQSCKPWHKGGGQERSFKWKRKWQPQVLAAVHSEISLNQPWNHTLWLSVVCILFTCSGFVLTVISEAGQGILPNTTLPGFLQISYGLLLLYRALSAHWGHLESFAGDFDVGALDPHILSWLQYLTLKHSCGFWVYLKRYLDKWSVGGQDGWYGGIFCVYAAVQMIKL